MIKIIYQKIINTHKKEGITGVFGKIKTMILNNVSIHRYFWYERDLSIPISDMLPRLSVCVDIHSKDEVARWIKLKFYNENSFDHKAYEIDMARENNVLFPSLKLNGNIVSFAKVGFGRIYIKNFKTTFHFREGVVFIYSAYTDPKYRNFGLIAFLETCIMKFVKKEGYRKICCHIRTNNTASIHAATKCGFRKIGSSWQFVCFDLNVFNGPPKELLDYE